MRSRPSPLVAAPTGRRFVAASLLLVLAACSTTAPTVRLHTLMPADLVPAGAAQGGAAGAAPIPVILEPIRVPAQVDQPQWVIRLPDDSLAVLEQERWASSLRDELREALLEQLAAGFGVVEARAAVAGAPSPMRISVDVRRFESLPGREARSEGSWTVGSGAGAAAVRCEWLIREPAPGPVDALAAPHRRGVARLGAAIGAAVVNVKAGRAAACPPLDERG